MRRALARLLGLAGGAAALAGVSSGLAARAPEVDDLACRIDHTINGGVVEIRGVATSRAGGQGTYRLLVQKVGSAGSSNLSQGGQIQFEPGGPANVGSVSVSVEPGGRYVAVLTIDLGEMRKECRASGETDLKL